MSGLGIVALADGPYLPGTETPFLSARRLLPVSMVCFDLGITGE